ncbi:MAG: 16S rRNA (uracil(1498)-N(3))-methyltransferase [Desulfobacterales bacterium]|nr:MAG: 16S rRNA (uracil(1498)-N(3))-methyltransferase [Desulfobacterales bacterium]
MGGTLAAKRGEMMRRFFFDPAEEKDGVVRLGAEESHHLAKVLRLQAGDEVELFDGAGRVYTATILSANRQAELALGEVCLEEKAGGAELVLLQSVLKTERMDLAIQKATELGVTRLLPIHTSRCQGKLSAAVKRVARWRRISLAACKQCMRPHIMEIMEPVAMKEALATLPPDFAKILFWEEEEQCGLQKFTEKIAAAPGVAICLGPEGGITVEEAECAKQLGWQSVSLGRRVLRAETATITTVSLMQFFMGNLG